MNGRLAVDFGTSNTVVAAWDDTAGEARPVQLGDYGRASAPGSGASAAGDGAAAGAGGEAGEAETEAEAAPPVIPSLIHYADDGRRWIGDQVERRNLAQDPRTFRWIKQYIANRSPGVKRVEGGGAMGGAGAAAGADAAAGGGRGREVSFFEAGRDFLSAVLASASEEYGAGGEEVVLTVPVESFEHYDDWLGEVAEAAAVERFRFIDEPSAAALGYGLHIQPGDVFLVFDFGGGTLDVAVVRIEEEAQASGRCCRVLGKAGADLGGSTVDQWLYREVLRSCGRDGNEPGVRAVSNLLLLECRRAKEALSARDRAGVSAVDPGTGAALAAEFSRAEFEALLDRHDALAQVDRTIRRALTASGERGFGDDAIKSVLMVGGSSLIPCVQQTVRRIFGGGRVQLRRPLDAVARGAAALASGIEIHDHIQHDYAIRYIDPGAGAHAFRTIVPRGTPYPTAQPVARLTIKASHDGQTKFGLALFELGQGQGRSNDNLELVFDPSGNARVVEVSAAEREGRSQFWMNEHSPTFLESDAPADRGERCFQVAFDIDSNKRLLLTAVDQRTGRTVLRDLPVVKLR